MVALTRRVFHEPNIASGNGPDAAIRRGDLESTGHAEEDLAMWRAMQHACPADRNADGDIALRLVQLRHIERHSRRREMVEKQRFLECAEMALAGLIFAELYDGEGFQPRSSSRACSREQTSSMLTTCTCQVIGRGCKEGKSHRHAGDISGNRRAALSGPLLHGPIGER